MKESSLGKVGIYKGWEITPLVFTNPDTGKFLASVKLKRDNNDGSMAVSSLDFSELFDSHEAAEKGAYRLAIQALDRERS